MNNDVDVVVISLERATERRDHIRSQFAQLPYEWSFFDAHTSLAHPDLGYEEERVLARFGRTLSIPERAVWSSHYAVIKRFLEESPNEFLLVFEDDVIFDTQFPVSKVTDLCVEHDIHYMRLYGMYNADAVDLTYFYDRSIIRYKSSPAGAQAYIMSKEGARKFTESSRHIEATVDLAMDYFWRTGLPLYAVFPFPVIERFSPTSIPMQPEPSLSARDRSVWTANRILNRLCKSFENSRLAHEDARIKKKSLRFQQIHSDDMASG